MTDIAQTCPRPSARTAIACSGLSHCASSRTTPAPHTTSNDVNASAATARSATSADVTMMTSALLFHGISYVRQVEDELRDWMREHDYRTIAEMRGALAATDPGLPGAPAHWGDLAHHDVEEPRLPEVARDEVDLVARRPATGDRLGSDVERGDRRAVEVQLVARPLPDDDRPGGADLVEDGPVEIEATAEFPKRGLFDVHTKYSGVAKYTSGVKLISSAGRAGVKFIGDKGWLWVTRGSWKAEPASILKEKIGPDEVHLPKSTNHMSNFLEYIRSSKDPIAKAEIGHRLARRAYQRGELDLAGLQSGIGGVDFTRND